MELKVISLDPSLNNTGIAVCRVLLPSLEILVDRLYLADTEKTKGKQVRRNSDDLRRAEEIVEAIMKFGEGAAFAIAEVPTGSQSARGSMSNGICVGVLASLKVMGLPLIQVQPTDTKLASVGKKTASKDEIKDWAYAKYPDAGWLTRKLKGEIVPIADNEHLADAVAAAHAGILTAEFQQAIALMGGMKRVAA